MEDILHALVHNTTDRGDNHLWKYFKYQNYLLIEKKMPLRKTGNIKTYSKGVFL